MPFRCLEGEGDASWLRLSIVRGLKVENLFFQIGYLWKGLQRRRERGTEGVRKEVEMVKGFEQMLQMIGGGRRAF